MVYPKKGTTMETTGRKSIGFMGLGLGGVYPKGPGISLGGSGMS